MQPYEITHHEHAGHSITLKWFYDHDCEAPWDHEDGHGPVTGWVRRDKRPGERLLYEDHGARRFYNFAEAVKIARRDGWDAPPYKTGTKGQQAVRAVEADFEYLRRWCNDDWHWCGYTIEVEGLGYQDSLWGIDSDSFDHFEQQALTIAREWIDRETVECLRAACADIITA